MHWYHPEKIRYEIVSAVSDGVGVDLDHPEIEEKQD
jgi:hypothetical protein